MFCSKCGKKVTATDAYCSKCGTKVQGGKLKNQEENKEFPNYFEFSNLFSGRISRRNYWGFFFLVFPLNIILGFVPIGDFGAFVFFIWFLVCLLLGFSLVVRRLHDANLSAWYLLLGIIPFVMLIFLLLPPVEERNKFGEYKDRRFSFPLIFGLRRTM